MLILGIETSCDETAASLIHVVNNDIRVLSNVISSQIKLHAKYGGVVPSLAAREHIKNLPKVLKECLGKYRMADIDLIAVTRGPGLVSSLLVGTTFAKTLAWKYKKPIIGVNHLKGHISSNWLPPVTGNHKSQITNHKKISSSKLFPALCLIVSGGHTELILMKDIGEHKLIGQTLDDAAGEAFDKIARILGLGYPGGPAIAATASKLKVKGEKLKVKLPRPMINSKNFDFSFSGLKTAVLYLTRDLTKTYPLSKIRTEIATEAQQAIVDVLKIKTMRAAEKYKVKSIMLSGGVSANRLLRSQLQAAAEQMGIKFFMPVMEYTTDNAAMIAIAGYFEHITTRKKYKNSAKGGSASGGKKTADWQSVKVDSNLRIAKAL